MGTLSDISLLMFPMEAVVLHQLVLCAVHSTLGTNLCQWYSARILLYQLAFKHHCICCCTSSASDFVFALVMFSQLCLYVNVYIQVIETYVTVISVA